MNSLEALIVQFFHSQGFGWKGARFCGKADPPGGSMRQGGDCSWSMKNVLLGLLDMLKTNILGPILGLRLLSFLSIVPVGSQSQRLALCRRQISLERADLKNKLLPSPWVCWHNLLQSVLLLIKCLQLLEFHMLGCVRVQLCLRHATQKSDELRGDGIGLCFRTIG